MRCLAWWEGGALQDFRVVHFETKHRSSPSGVRRTERQEGRNSHGMHRENPALAYEALFQA